MSFTAPNWRDPDAYPSHEKHEDLSFWAWQFLRRNKKYQAEWADYVSSLAPLFKRSPESRTFFAIHSYIDASFFPSLKEQPVELWDCALAPGETTILDYLKRAKTLRTKTAALGESWGLEELQSPGLEWLGRRGFIEKGPRASFIFHERDQAKIEDPNYALLRFDLRLPVASLKQQFAFLLMERARRIDEGEVHPHDGRISLVKYVNYLRVLDAVDASATAAQIAEVLVPYQDKIGQKQTIENWKRAAVALREDGFRTLPAYTSK